MSSAVVSLAQLSGPLATSPAGRMAFESASCVFRSDAMTFCCGAWG
jgi:hypothetical protein